MLNEQQIYLFGQIQTSRQTVGQPYSYTNLLWNKLALSSAYNHDWVDFDSSYRCHLFCCTWTKNLGSTRGGAASTPSSPFLNSNVFELTKLRREIVSKFLHPLTNLKLDTWLSAGNNFYIRASIFSIVRQCDQIWRNFANLAKNKFLWSTYWRFI